MANRSLAKAATVDNPGKLSRAPVKSSESAAIDIEEPSMETRFRALVEQWHRDTDQLSDLHEVLNHPAYQQIINMGPPVVPLVLQELLPENGLWATALKSITGEDPVPPEATTLSQVREAWMEYGRRHRFL